MRRLAWVLSAVAVLAGCIDFDRASDAYCAQKPFACGAPSGIGDGPGGTTPPPPGGPATPDAPVPGTTGCTVFDPAKPWIFGFVDPNLQQGTRTDRGPAIARGERRTFGACVSLPPQAMHLQIRPSDQAVLYVDFATSHRGIFKYVKDPWTQRAGVNALPDPALAPGNDERIAVGCPDVINMQIEADTSGVYYQCGSTGAWFNPAGTHLGTAAIRSVGANYRLVSQAGVLSLVTRDGAPVTLFGAALPASGTFVAFRARRDHFLAFANMGTTTTSGEGRLYRIGHGGSVTLETTYPSDTLYGDCVLDGAGVPYCRSGTLYHVVSATGRSDLPTDVPEPNPVSGWRYGSWEQNLAEVFVYSRHPPDPPSLITGP